MLLIHTVRIPLQAVLHFTVEERDLEYSGTHTLIQRLNLGVRPRNSRGMRLSFKFGMSLKSFGFIVVQGSASRGQVRQVSGTHTLIQRLNLGVCPQIPRSLTGKARAQGDADHVAGDD